MPGDGGPPPLVTVVTVVRNGAATLERTIESVLAQDQPGLEYLIVDGGSTDGTVDIIQRYAARLAGWVSEPDRGISDAFNKGVARARGEFIGLLNADDRYTPGAVARAVAALRAAPAAGWAFGHMVQGHGERWDWLNLGDPAYGRRIDSWMPDVNHPTIFVRRSVYERMGGFDLGLRYAMDYDFLLRCHRAGVCGVLVPEVQTLMSLRGVSDRDWRRAFAEVREVSVRHGRPRWRARLLFARCIAKGVLRRSLEGLGVLAWTRRVRLASQRRMLQRRW